MRDMGRRPIPLRRKGKETYNNAAREIVEGSECIEQEGAKHQPVVGVGEGASDRGREGAAEEVGAGIRTEAKDNGGGLVSTESSGHVQQNRAEDASVKELVGHEGFRDATRVRANVGA